MPKTTSRFWYTALRRAYMAEERRAEREEHGGELWEVKITSAMAGDYHRSGDVVIVEMAS